MKQTYQQVQSAAVVSAWNNRSAAAELVRSSRNIHFVAAAMLIVVAVVFFRDHLLGRASFTWDFFEVYYPPTVYITEHLKRFIWPEWVSRQSLGVPLYMMPQSDLYYPTTWIVVALRLQYTLWLANLFQIIHIIFGGFGAYFLGRSYRLGNGALLVGLGYMLMGGFFMQSQHVDYVRGFAFGPWLFVILDLDGFVTRPLARSLGLVALVGLIVLGAYPGQIPAFIIVGLVYLIALIVRSKRSLYQNALPLALIVASVALGLGLGIPKYLPFVLDFASESVRAGITQKDVNRLEPVHLFGLVLNTGVGDWPLDVSVRSYFVTAPVVLLALSATRASILRVWPMLLAAIVALALAFDVPLRLLPSRGPFGYSRFPICDYKLFVALGIIMLAGAVFHDFESLPLKRIARLLIRGGLAFIFFYGVGCILVLAPADWWSGKSLTMILPGLVTAAAASLLLCFRAKSPSPRVALAFTGWALLTVALDATRAYTSLPNWRTTGIPGQQTSRLGYNTILSVPKADDMFMQLAFRPERVNVGHIDWISGRGFYSGVFVYEGYDVSRRLVRYGRILDIYHKHIIPPPAVGLPRFMQRPSAGLLLPPGASNAQIEDAITAASRDERDTALMPAGVTMKSYGDTALEYEVDLQQPSLFVENEMFWNGWSGTLRAWGTEHVIGKVDPTEQLGTIRSWLLPAGHYLFSEHYSDPHLRKALLTALAIECPLLFIVVLLISSLARRARAREANSD